MEQLTLPSPEPWEPDMLVDFQQKVEHDDCNLSWLWNLQDKWPLHPVITAMLKYRPADPIRLIMEHPYISETDLTRLAYTRSVEHGVANRQTITSIGKYLARMWPQVDSIVRRDAALLYTPDKMSFIYTREEIIASIECGPRSCMQSGYGSIQFGHQENETLLAWLDDNSNPEPNWDLHPYSVYNPEFGWHAATRRNGMTKRIDGRALCLKTEKANIFVRSYKRANTPEGYSESDPALEVWLQSRGYVKDGYWPIGSRLTCSVIDEKIQLPYIDGNHRCTVQIEGDLWAITTEHEATHYGTNTSGFAQPIRKQTSRHQTYDEDDENTMTCECCDETVHEDDIHCVGREEDVYVCNSCYEDEYTLVRGTRPGSHRTHEYYVHNDHAVEVLNQDVYIDERYPPDWARELANGNWAHEYAVVNIDDEYYLHDDDDIILLDVDNPDNGDSYALIEDTWVCEATQKRYHNNTESVEIDGLLYHPDDVPEQEQIELELVVAPPPIVVRETLAWPFVIPKLEHSNLEERTS